MDFREHIAIIQLARFGDMIQTSPLLQQLKRESPDPPHLTLIVDERSAEAAELLVDVDDLIRVNVVQGIELIQFSKILRTDTLREWINTWKPDFQFDRLIVLNDSPLARAIAAFIHAETKAGPLKITTGDLPHRYLHVLTRHRLINPLHLAEIWAAYSRNFFPIPPPRVHHRNGISFAKLKDSFSSLDRNNKSIAINLGAGAAGRTLPPEKIAVLGDILLRKIDCNLLLLGLQRDSEVADKVIQGTDPSFRDRILNLAGKTELSVLVDLLDSVDLLISSDTGTLQLAAATEARSLGLFFGGANPVETGAYRTGSFALFDTSGLDGIYHEEHRTALRLSVQPLAELIIGILNSDANELKWNDNAGISLQVAKSETVGTLYRPYRTGEKDSLSPSERCSTLARYFLWGAPPLRNQSLIQASGIVAGKRT